MKTKPNDKVNADILVSEYVGSPKYKTNKYHHEQQGGLTKREHFAALAMQGLLTIFNENEQNPIVPNEPNVKYMAILSVKSADALIEELNKSQNQQP